MPENKPNRFCEENDAVGATDAVDYPSEVKALVKECVQDFDYAIAHLIFVARNFKKQFNTSVQLEELFCYDSMELSSSDKVGLNQPLLKSQYQARGASVTVKKRFGENGILIHRKANGYEVFILHKRTEEDSCVKEGLFATFKPCVVISYCAEESPSPQPGAVRITPSRQSERRQLLSRNDTCITVDRNKFFHSLRSLRDLSAFARDNGRVSLVRQVRYQGPEVILRTKKDKSEQFYERTYSFVADTDVGVDLEMFYLSKHHQFRNDPGFKTWIIRQVMATLQALHDQGEVHRDPRMPNFLVRRDGQLQLIDLDYVCNVKEDSHQAKAFYDDWINCIFSLAVLLSKSVKDSYIKNKYSLSAAVLWNVFLSSDSSDLKDSWHEILGKIGLKEASKLPEGHSVNSPQSSSSRDTAFEHTVCCGGCIVC